MTDASNRLKRLRQSTLLRNSGWMLAGQGLRILVQAIYFVIIARALGVAQYGAFIGATALVAVLAPFATWGSGTVLIKNVARRPPSFAHYWGASLHATLVSGAVLSAVTLAVSRFILPSTIEMSLLLQIILADLLFARLVDLGGQAFQAHQRLSRTAATQFSIGILRLLGAVLLFVLMREHATATAWASFYLGASIVSATLTIVLVQRELGSPLWTARLTRTEARDGFHFAVTASAASINADIDKTMLARLATLDAAGFYAAGYRIIDVCFVPIRSVLYAAYSRFFSAGEAGIRAATRFAARILPSALAYSFVAGIGIYVIAPVVPRFLGPEYEKSVVVLRMLCVLPLIRTFHTFAADTLTGADHQGVRTAIQAVVALINVALNVVLIPAYSWRGAVWTTVISDVLLAIALWISIYILSEKVRTKVTSADHGSEVLSVSQTPIATRSISSQS